MLLAATTGMAVSKHFCNGFLISSSIYTEAGSCCDKDCCQDHSEFIQLDEEFQVSESQAMPPILELVLFISKPGFFHLLNGNENVQILSPENEPPPPTVQIRLSLKQAYLI
jgi:hypothetical protein